MSDPGDAEGSEAGGENPLRKLSIPPYIADKVWTEGQELASTVSNVCTSPGCTDGGSWLVKSNSATHQKPFFVECKKTGQISCEKSCLSFNSCSVCAHTVAVATRNRCLENLISWLCKRGSMNVTRMAHSGLPKGAGKKVHSRRKFSAKTTTRNVKRILQEAGDGAYTPRAGVTTRTRSEPQHFQISGPSEDNLSTSASPLYPAPPPAPPLYPAPPPPAPPPSQVQSCDLSGYSAPPQGYSYPQVTPGCSSHLPGPPPLIRAPVQLSMPFMYAPMYLPPPGQVHEQSQTRDTQQGNRLPFILAFVKGNISRCAGCGQKDLRDPSGKAHPPPDDLCLLHKEYITFENPNTGVRQKSMDRRNVYYHARKSCVLRRCDQPKRF